MTKSKIIHFVYFYIDYSPNKHSIMKKQLILKQFIFYECRNYYKK